MNNPLVSICCITYNHEQFIAQAIESFLMQQTNFDYEIVIGEDCSKDKTGEIVGKYALQYPKKIRILDNSKNLGLQENFFRTLHSCKGTYIAYCEGDDYWIDPLKLQKQADVFKNNPEVVYCFTNAYAMDEISKIKTPIFDNADTMMQNFSVDDYMKNYHAMPMLTTFFKASTIKLVPSFLYSIIQLDYALRFIIGNQGDFYFLPEVTAVYRKHQGGIANNNIPFLLSMIQVNKHLNTYFNYKYNHFFGYYPYMIYEKLSYAYSSKKMYRNALYYVGKSIFVKKNTLRPYTEIKIVIKHLLKLLLYKK